jgi:hypothetical protein
MVTDLEEHVFGQWVLRNPASLPAICSVVIPAAQAFQMERGVTR